MSKISRQLISFQPKLVKLNFVFATRRQLIHLPQDFSTFLSIYTKRLGYKLQLSRNFMDIFVKSKTKQLFAWDSTQKLQIAKDFM